MPSTPDFTGRADKASESIERTAADWFVLHDRGLNSAQQAEFNRWLKADRRHAENYAEMKEIWEILGRARPPVQSVGARSGHSRLFWVPVALAAAATIALVFALWRGKSGPNRNFSESAATEIGVLRRLDLPDGSVVKLSADSAVEVSFSSRQRSVLLTRGEANFEVAKNMSRPFVVRVESVYVRAVGTAFDVRLLSDSINVLVTEGRVWVSDSSSGRSLLAATGQGASPVLSAGQGLRVRRSAAGNSSAAAATVFSPEEMKEALAWEERRLFFHDDRLADIVAEFNRFNRHRLAIGSPELAERKFGGTFPANDYEAFVRSLERHYEVTADWLPNETVLRLLPDLGKTLTDKGPVARLSASSAAQRLIFGSRPLTEIVAEFNRYNRHRLVIEDPALGARRFGGTFPAHDYEAFVKDLEENFHVAAERGPEETILRGLP